MKKIFFVLFFVFITNVSNTSAVTQTGLNNLSTSFDIGSYMQTTYYRYKCNSKDRCEKTQTKTDGDFGSESECLKNCPNTPVLYNPSNINNNFNFTVTSTTKASLNYQKTNNLDIASFQMKTQSTPQVNLPKVSPDGIAGLDFGPSTITKTTLGLNIAPPTVNNNSLAKPTTKTNSIEALEPVTLGKSIFTNLLQGLGVIKPASLLPDKNIATLDGPHPTYPPEPQPEEDDFIWYLENYGFKIWGDIIKGGDHLSVSYGQEVPIDGAIKMQKNVYDRWADIGLLYSYTNEKGDRVFDNETADIFIPASSNPKGPTEWYTSGTPSFKIKIPNDIKVTNKTISFEMMIVAEPATYGYLKNPSNNYKTWNSFDKANLSFNFLDKQNSRDFLKTNCKFKFITPEPKTTFVPGKDPYHTDFNLSVGMDCDQLLKTKNKPDPQSVHIYYEMKCPKQFNSDYTEWYAYQETFATGNKYFDIDFHTLDIYQPVFSQKFELENSNLLDMLYSRKQQAGQEDFGYVYPYGLAKRCDLVARIYSNGYEIATLKDYFYLNQCKVNIINENPDAVYCTENERGGRLPINLKIVFSNCSRDMFDYNSLDYLYFEITPNATPNKQEGDVRDNRWYYNYVGATSLLDNIDKNGQTLFSDINGVADYQYDYWKDYFTKKGVTKNMAENPSRLGFLLKAYEYKDLMFVLPMENRGTNDQFKIYYGSNYDNCYNNKKSVPNPMPTLPSAGMGSINKPEPKPSTILSRILNFFGINLK